MEKTGERVIFEKVEALLSKMTLPQKVAQLQTFLLIMNQVGAIDAFPEDVGNIEGLFGGQTTESNADICQSVQDRVIGQTEHKIPALFNAEALTGLIAAGATAFPSAIAMGATWNPDIVEEMAEVIRKQMLAVGYRQAYAPVMDVARDPRWGRIGETYGEDPTLCSALSVAYTKGIQGKDWGNGILATAKHFLGYGFSEGGLNQTSNPIPPRELREVYAKPFQAAITMGGLQGVMNSYGVIDSELIVTSKHILTELLRDEMGFDGIVVSDAMSVNRAVSMKVSEDSKTAGIDALRAGLDVEIPFPYGFTNTLIDAVNEGILSEEIINCSVRRVLLAKFRFGLFENAYAKTELIPEAYGRVNIYSKSIKAAHESIVLLKNDGILPLNKNLKQIAVIGPHADSVRLCFGGYSYPASIDMMLGGNQSDMAGMADMDGDPDEAGFAMFETPTIEGSAIREEAPIVEETLRQLYGDYTPTILESIQKICPDAQVVYEKGCEIAGTSRKRFEAAVATAQSADVVILILGGKFGNGASCTIGEGVDSNDIGLPGIQEEFAREIFSAGTPTVFVHMDARPLSSEYVAENFPAIIENWFPGDTGGQALADVLFGDYNPAGRLPATAARNAGQIPIYAMHKTGNSYIPINGMAFNKYAEGSKLPLFCFGEGKSYTSFEYSNLVMDKNVKADGIIKLSCDVMNSGEVDGEEVVQVYVTDELASMVRPNKELAGFKRVAIKAGEKKTVRFTVRADQFAFLNKDMDWIVEAGTMTVRIGGSSEDIRLIDSFEIENTQIIDGKVRGFFAETAIDN